MNEENLSRSEREISEKIEKINKKVHSLSLEEELKDKYLELKDLWLEGWNALFLLWRLEEKNHTFYPKKSKSLINSLRTLSQYLPRESVPPFFSYYP